ncbi:MAG: DNA polymerase I [Gammaproteobacteria bacterium]
MAHLRLVLVDGSSYLYRAFHALPALSTSTGQPTGAIHGVVAMLKRLVKDYRPDYMAVVFDAKGKTFRDRLYPEYKAHRPPMPVELAAQIEPLHGLVRALGLPLVMVEDVEADDVIGTLAKSAGRGGIETIVSTGDKDLAQLVDAQVTLINTMDNTVLDVAGVEQRFGVPPTLIVDYLALVGDKVDNVPGVPKVGPKTAVHWLKEYGSLEGVVANAGAIQGRIGEYLRESLAQLPLSRRLLTVDCDLKLAVQPRDLRPAPADRAALQRLYTDLEMKTWLGELLAEAPTPTGATDTAPALDYQVVLDTGQFEHWLTELGQAALIAFDTETTSLDYMQAEVVGVSFAVAPGRAAYVPLAHRYPGAPEQLGRERVLARLKPILEDPQRAKLGHNLKYDRNVLANHGIELQGIRHDSMLESYVLDSTATRHDLDALALKYLGLRTIHYEDVAGKGARQLRFDEVPIEQAGPYAAEDADVALKLHAGFWPRLQAEPGLQGLYESIEIPLVPVLSRMERNGVLIDQAMLRAQSGELAARLESLEESAHASAGQPFNIDSPKQIQAILYEKLGLPITTRTPTGQPSTAESVLQDLALDYPLPKLILEYRALAKLRSTYTDKLPGQVDARTGRVHTSYHQAVAATGRLSSADPNLQNIPVRSQEGRRIRQAFVAPPGYRLVSADYSQIELRIMAHLSGDRRLREAFASGQDVHRATAAEVFGVASEAVSDEARRTAKAINFGLIYGMSAFGLARQLGIERSAAQAYVDRYFTRYAGVKDYMEQARRQARQQGYVETVFRRRLYTPDIRSSNQQRRQYAERTAINAPMQGTAADIIKRAMIETDRWLLESRLDARLIMQVHDELVLEVAEAAVEMARERLAAIMSAAAQLSVPLLVDVGVGANWGEAH